MSFAKEADFEDALVEILSDYKDDFGTEFVIATHGKFKKDVALRLAHKVPYDIDSHITEIETDDIDTDYMNSRFRKYYKMLNQPNVTEEEMQSVLDELHKSFAALTQEEQKYANVFLGDVQSGNIVMQENMQLRDYITEYMVTAKNDRIHKMSEAIGVDEDQLRDFMAVVVTESNINEYGRFDSLKATANIPRAQEYFLRIEGVQMSPAKTRMRIHQYLQKFILEGGFDLQLYTRTHDILVPFTPTLSFFWQDIRAYL